MRTRNKPRGYIYGAFLTFPVEGQMLAVPVEARVCRAIVGEQSHAEHWATKFTGERRYVIECKFNKGGVDETFYLDAQADKQILWKVTAGRGDPSLGGIRQLAVANILEDDAGIHSFYRMVYTGKKDNAATYRLIHGALPG